MLELALHLEKLLIFQLIYQLLISRWMPYDYGTLL